MYSNQNNFILTISFWCENCKKTEAARTKTYFRRLIRSQFLIGECKKRFFFGSQTLDIQIWKFYCIFFSFLSDHGNLDIYWLSSSMRPIKISSLCHLEEVSEWKSVFKDYFYFRSDSNFIVSYIARCFH